MLEITHEISIPGIVMKKTAFFDGDVRIVAAASIARKPGDSPGLIARLASCGRDIAQTVLSRLEDMARTDVARLARSSPAGIEAHSPRGRADFFQRGAAIAIEIERSARELDRHHAAGSAGGQDHRDGLETIGWRLADCKARDPQMTAIVAGYFAATRFDAAGGWRDAIETVRGVVGDDVLFREARDAFADSHAHRAMDPKTLADWFEKNANPEPNLARQAP
ncbi:MAG: hypothetical protein ING19_17195 [Azospirillum sp.]|nr:hypothetical protein [Azospirillum sp.]